jgi:hypothetical protein
MRPTRPAAMLAALLLAAAPARAQFTIGDALVPRTFLDAYQGFVLVLPYTFPAAALGDQVRSVSFFSDYAGAIGYAFTPLVLTDLGGGSFAIAGTGTPRANAATGVQSFNLELTGGSAVIGATTRVGFVTPTGQAGVIPFDFDADGNLYGFTASDDGPSAVGSTFTLLDEGDRAYSIEFSTQAIVSAVPEPASVVLLAGGLVALGGIATARGAARRGAQPTTRRVPC